MSRGGDGKTLNLVPGEAMENEEQICQPLQRGT